MVLLQNHLTDVYASQVPLLQLISDVCRLLSTQNDNPIYAADFSKYGENGYFAFFKSRFKSRINDHLTKNK